MERQRRGNSSYPQKGNKTPYLNRGKRARYGQCLICGEFYLKKERKRVGFVRNRDKNEEAEITTVYVTCDKNLQHGETVIEKRERIL